MFRISSSGMYPPPPSSSFVIFVAPSQRSQPCRLLPPLTTAHTSTGSGTRSTYPLPVGGTFECPRWLSTSTHFVDERPSQYRRHVVVPELSEEGYDAGIATTTAAAIRG